MVIVFAAEYKGLEIDSFQFKYTTLEKATQNFNATNKIGQGGFGEVFQVSNILVFLFYSNNTMCSSLINSPVLFLGPNQCTKSQSLTIVKKLLFKH